MKNRKPASSMIIENLEGRRLMSGTLELSQLAAQYPAHNGVSNLYLNFDGGNINDAMGSGNMSAYQADPGVDRDEMIRDIVYRVSEIFSPFNVRVIVIHGNGNFSKSGGDSTIFIGDDPANKDGGGFNATHSYVSWNSADYPGKANGVLHVPNSNAYDLGFVDPISFNPQPQALRSESALSIARNIAHEAGHTFGLAHDLSSPQKDVMSYDASNTAFLNTTLDITDLNFTGTTTEHTDYAWPELFSGFFVPPVKITQENTFAYLKNALGPRPIQSDSYDRSVADPSSVDGGYYDSVGFPSLINMASHPSATLARPGDYDVYTVNLPASQKPATGLTKMTLAIGNVPFQPEMMLYTADGQTLLASSPGASLVYPMKTGTSYELVIGGYMGASAGNYTLSLSAGQMASAPAVVQSTVPTVPPTSSPFLTDDSAQSAMASLFA